MNAAELVRRLGATTLFAPLPQPQLAALVARSTRHRSAAGDWLADPAAGLRDHVVLLAGEAEVRRTWVEPDGRRRTHARRVAVATGGPGFSLIGAAGSGLSVQALTATEHVSIDSEELDDLLGWTHLGAFALPEPHLKVFHRLPLENVATAIRRLAERPVAAGETVVTQGEPGDAYYILLDGEADVFEDDPATGTPVLVNRLSDGDSFGEEALLADTPRTATVRMTTPGHLLVLSRTDFDRLIRPPMVGIVAPRAAQADLERGTDRLLDCRSPAEHALSRIPGAGPMPLDRLRHDGVFQIDPQARYIVYCRNGRRSRAAAFLLHERGIRARSLDGGIAGWPYAVDETPL